MRAEHQSDGRRPAMKGTAMKYDAIAQLKDHECQRSPEDSDVDIRQLPEDSSLERPVNRRFFRAPKQSVTIRLDADVVAWFKAQAVERGYQTAINRALREYMDQHR